jgi:hypothetical protein
MDKRTRLLAIATAVLASLFVLDKAVTALVFDPLQKLNQELVKADARNPEGQHDAQQPGHREQNWNRVRDRLDLPRIPDSHTHFLTHLGELFEEGRGVLRRLGEPPARPAGRFQGIHL